MNRPFTTIMRLGATLGLLTAVALAIPIAQAWDGPPDAIDRYNNPAPLVFDGPPDAIDRYREAQVFAIGAVRPAWDGPPDAIDRYLGRTGPAIVVVPADEGFGWSEFGIGAGVAVGLALLIGGLALGAATFHHHHHGGGGGRLSPS